MEGYTFQQYSIASSTTTLWVVGVLEQYHHVEGKFQAGTFVILCEKFQLYDTLTHKMFWKVLKFLLCTVNDCMNVYQNQSVKVVL